MLQVLLVAGMRLRKLFKLCDSLVVFFDSVRTYLAKAVYIAETRVRHGHLSGKVLVTRLLPGKA